MKTIIGPKPWLAMASLCLFSAVIPLKAGVIYNNTTNDLETRFDCLTLEVGDEIVFEPGTERLLTNFTFEFWGTASPGPSFAGSVNAEVRFYLNDGPPFNGYPTPGTLLYDSGPFSINSPTDRSTATFVAGSDFPSPGLFLGLPGAPIITNMTWTVQFSGLGAGDKAGLDIYSPPVVGGNHTDYWENDGGNWTLKTNSIVMSFGAIMFANPVAQLNITPYPPYVIVSWSTNFSGYTLQTTTSLIPPSVWTTNSPGPVQVDGVYEVVMPASDTQRFFRLIQ